MPKLKDLKKGSHIIFYTTAQKPSYMTRMNYKPYIRSIWLGDGRLVITYGNYCCLSGNFFDSWGDGEKLANRSQAERRYGSNYYPESSLRNYLIKAYNDNLFNLPPIVYNNLQPQTIKCNVTPGHRKLFPAVVELTDYFTLLSASEVSDEVPDTGEGKYLGDFIHLLNPGWTRTGVKNSHTVYLSRTRNPLATQSAWKYRNFTPVIKVADTLEVQPFTDNNLSDYWQTRDDTAQRYLLSAPLLAKSKEEIISHVFG